MPHSSCHAPRENISWESFVEALPLASLVLNPQGEIISWNDSADSLLQLKSRDAQSLSVLELIVEDNQEGVQEIISAVSVSGKSFVRRVEFYLADQGSVWASVHLFPLRGESPSAANIGVVVRGASREIEQELEQEQRGRELQRLNQELDDFASLLAHDLREPLRSVRGFCDLLREKYDRFGGPDAAKYLNIISSSADRMDELINNLAEYARIAPHGPLPLSTVHLEELVEGVKDRLNGILSRKEAEVVTKGLPEVRANRPLLSQVLQNLIENAFKYRSDAPPKVVIHAEDDGDDWIISVSDNGIGIRAEHHERVFQPFQRLVADKADGTGIGLAICRKIIGRHGGSIWVESELGEGATFSFSLPKKKPHLEAKDHSG